MTVLEYAGYKRHRPGRIHLYCPGCGLKRSNVPREKYDPPKAVLAHLPCERCSDGCKVEGASEYLDSEGHSVMWEMCSSCGTEAPYYELEAGKCESCAEEASK